MNPGSETYAVRICHPMNSSSRTAAAALLNERKPWAMQCDILIQGGEVIDPSQQLRGVRDVVVRDGVILSVAENITEGESGNHHILTKFNSIWSKQTL